MLVSLINIKRIGAILVLTTAPLAPPAPLHAATPECQGARATIVGSPDDDRIRGTPRKDVIVARGGDDVVRGQAGRDLICGGRGSDSLKGQVGGDFIFGGGGRDHLQGGRDGDTLLGGDHSDRIYGGGATDRLLAGEDSGNDVWDGGKGGADWLIMSAPSSSGEPTGAPGPVRVDLARRTASGKAIGDDRLVGGSIENVYGTGMGDRIYGNHEDNLLDAGLWGHGILDGRGGNDILRTGEDGDTEMFGGPGDDQLVMIDYENRIDGGAGTDELIVCIGVRVTIDLTEGRAVIHHPDGDQVSSVAETENAKTCWKNDRLIGDDGPNHLKGGRNDDNIQGLGGDDRLDGGGGNDVLDGGEGTDQCVRGEDVSSCEG